MPYTALRTLNRLTNEKRGQGAPLASKEVGMDYERLYCRECGALFGWGSYPKGCPACAERGRLGILEVTYAYDGETRRRLQEALAHPEQRSLWRFEALLPLPEGAQPITLGEGGTPLVAAPWLGHFTGLERVYLKNETANPTWCSKDRVNTVSITVGHALGAHGIVASTTGNHGASMVAYSARAGIPAVALCSPHSDIIHRAMIAALGGTAIVSERREEIVKYLVQQQGWFPATSMADSDGPNPYGVEGCKTIAYEIYETLHGLPDAVLVPAASGDLLYGVFKGFRELAELGLTDRVPRMIGCQAEGAAPLALALREHLDEVPVLPHPATVAISIGDDTSGKCALEAVRASGGDVVTISDDDILAAQRQLAANGLLLETASCSSVAALKAAVARGALGAEKRAVCLVTGAAVKWSTQLISQALGRVLLEPSLETVRTHVCGQC
jgi:threonine synthase